MTASPSEFTKWSRRQTRVLMAAGVALVLLGAGVALGTFYVDSVPTPEQLSLPESTTVYYADGKTPMATLGAENRTILAYGDINEAVKQSVVAAEDQTYWSNPGVDFRSVIRAAWNNATGGKTQGASTITQQYARVAADLKGVTYSRKLREAVIAWKLDRKYTKEEILGFYLNTVPFGRGAYGIEAAAEAYFGKTVNRNASADKQITVAEAMVLVSMVKQPEPDPNDPDGSPGYDPTRNDKAKQNSVERWNYVRDQMVRLGYLTSASQVAYPTTIKPYDPARRQNGLDKPTGLAVRHVLSELRQVDPFKGKAVDYIANGGFQIVTTIDKRAQDAAEAAADIRRTTAPAAVRGQPGNWQAALASVEPGTGRVLAYYGGNDGSGADYAGWYYDDAGDAVGFGQHPPGSSFKVYDLAEAIRQKVSVKQKFDSPPSKEFPESGRTKSSPAGPIRNAASAPCQPNCMLWEATVASLNTTFFGLTEQLGPANVVDMAIKAGVDSIWANEPGQPRAVRIDLRGKSGAQVMPNLSTEVGIGQYGITVLDHANGVATFAAGGKRAEAHFVRSVRRGGDEVYAEKITTKDIGLNADQINELNWTLAQVAAAKLNNGWDVAGKTGTWQRGQSTTENVAAWMVGYTRPLAAAVWLGTTDGAPLTTKDGSFGVSGAGQAAPIWRQYMTTTTAALKLDPRANRFGVPKFPPESTAPSGPATPSAPPPPSTPAQPQPTCVPPKCGGPKPTPTAPPPPTPPPTPPASAPAEP